MIDEPSPRRRFELACPDIDHYVCRHGALELFVKQEVARPRLSEIARNEICIEAPQSFGVRELPERLRPCLKQQRAARSAWPRELPDIRNRRNNAQIELIRPCRIVRRDGLPEAPADQRRA